MKSFDKFIIALVLISLVRLSVQFNIDLNTAAQNITKGPIVAIPSLGWLRGSIAITKWTNRPFFQFLGIQYAESPSGKRRFKAPVPLKSWSGIKNAVQMGQSCVQGGSITFKPVESSKDIEDCLNMNIYTPSISSNGRLKTQYPVLVYIHGGSFSSGSNAEYPPDYVLERDIVLVVPNYRLDALGFLSTKTAEIPGNAGALDVLLALKWIKQNIKYFGGNPNKITVMGQSSGAAMVSSLLLSPLVPENLFQQMIVHSGSIFASWAWALDPVSYSKDIAKRANVPKNATINEINAAFMNMNVYDLINATNEHYNAGNIKGSNRVGGRSLTIGGPSKYLTMNPKELLRQGYFKKNVKLIAGVVQNEGSFLTAILYDKLKSLRLLNNSWFMKNMFIRTVVNALGVQDQWLKVYDFSKSIFRPQIVAHDYNFVSYVPGFSHLAGVVSIKEPVLKLVQANAFYNPSNTFLYSFDYRGVHSRFGYEKNISRYPFDGGVSHSDDLIYLFPYPQKVANLNADDTEMARNFIELWTSFVMNGTPELESIQWPAFTKYTGPYLHISKEFTVAPNFRDEFAIGLKDSSSGAPKEGSGRL